MSRRDITDIELIQGSKGIQEDEHDSKNCDPVIEPGYYMRDNHNYSDVVFHLRYCKCTSYNHKTCRDNLKNFRETSVILPTDGISMHRLDCIYELKKLKRHDWEGNERRTRYKYVYTCTCRYPLNPKTARHDPNDRGEFLVYIKYKSQTITFVVLYFVLSKILLKTVLFHN